MKKYLSQDVFEALTLPVNLKAIANRFLLVGKRAEALRQLKKNHDKKYMMNNPLTGEPLLKNDGSPKLLSSAFAKSKKFSQKEQDFILGYIEKKRRAREKMKTTLKRSYRKRIFSDKNRLQFPTLEKNSE